MVTLRHVYTICALILLVGCSTQEVMYAHSVPLSSAQAPYAEAELLDVGVVLFNSGIPDGELDREAIEELMQDGTFIQIRRAESILLSQMLRDTLVSSGYWGSVWVTPEESTAVDLNVDAEILQSDGYILELRVHAVDATGEEWLDKKYQMETAESAFNRLRYPNIDPYQDVFNQIANDLASVRAQKDPAEIAEVRSLGELRYASDLSPEAFGDYLQEGGDGVFRPVRLPAVNDPMLQRSNYVRQREQLFFDTMDQYFRAFLLETDDSYRGYRESSRDDSIAMAEAARAAKTRTAIGALAIALSITTSSQLDGNSLANALLRDSGLYIGGDLLRSAAVRRQEKRFYRQDLEENSTSFDTSVKTLVIDVRGTQHRLTGTVEAKYEEFQRLLREIFISETGLVPEDISIYAEPQTEGDSDAGAKAAEEVATDADGGTASDA